MPILRCFQQQQRTNKNTTEPVKKQIMNRRYGDIPLEQWLQMQSSQASNNFFFDKTPIVVDDSHSTDEMSDEASEDQYRPVAHIPQRLAPESPEELDFYGRKDLTGMTIHTLLRSVPSQVTMNMEESVVANDQAQNGQQWFAPMSEPITPLVRHLSRRDAAYRLAALSLKPPSLQVEEELPARHLVCRGVPYQRRDSEASALATRKPPAEPVRQLSCRDVPYHDEPRQLSRRDAHRQASSSSGLLLRKNLLARSGPYNRSLRPEENDNASEALRLVRQVFPNARSQDVQSMLVSGMSVHSMIVAISRQDL